MRVVLTNDDGWESAGLHALARACEEAGHDVLVVAPAADLSGASASIGRIRADQRIDTRRVTLAGSPETEAHALTGPPGLAAMAACLGAFGPEPDLVLSGINAGRNTGHATLHSGTVGAALTAATFGVSALALSVDVGEPMHWDSTLAHLDTAMQLLAELPTGTVLNLNAPALPPADVPGLRWAELDRFGSVRVAVTSTGDDWVQMEYQATGAELDPLCDTALLEQGYATLTALEGVAAIPPDELRSREGRTKQLQAVLSQLPGAAAQTG